MTDRLTTVISVRGRKREELLLDPDFIYCGRGVARTQWGTSEWGNPFKVNSGGRRKSPFRTATDADCSTAEEAVAKYREWLLRNIETSREFRAKVASLKGRKLGCWCCDWPGFGEPAKPCHAVFLAKMADALGSIKEAVESTRGWRLTDEELVELMQR